MDAAAKSNWLVGPQLLSLRAVAACLFGQLQYCYHCLLCLPRIFAGSLSR